MMTLAWCLVRLTRSLYVLCQMVSHNGTWCIVMSVSHESKILQISLILKPGKSEEPQESGRTTKTGGTM